MFALPFYGEKRVKLFRRALLEIIEGSRLLAPTASTGSISGFCAAVDTAACASRIPNQSISGFTLRTLPMLAWAVFTLRTLPMLAVLWSCSALPIDIRYQVSGVRSTTHARSISGYLLRLLIEYFMARYCAYSTRPVLAVIWADTASCCLLRCCYCCCCSAACCYCCGCYYYSAAAAAAAAAAVFAAVLLLLLSLPCEGEAISPAQAPLAVGTARRR